MTRPHLAEAATLLRMAWTQGVTLAQRFALIRAAGHEMARDAAEQTQRGTG